MPAAVSYTATSRPTKEEGRGCRGLIVQRFPISTSKPLRSTLGRSQANQFTTEKLILGPGPYHYAVFDCVIHSFLFFRSFQNDRTFLAILLGIL